MGSVIFDFDSTLISCESLEVILKTKLHDAPALQQAIHDLTIQGMEGVISFSESLQKRLKLAAPSKADIVLFAKEARRYLTPGMPELIAKLQKANIDVWIVSGALRDAILPTAEYLSIPKEQVLAIEALWDDKGEFLGIAPHDRFALSKVEGCKAYVEKWSKPSVVIGDGMTDYALYNTGLAQHFIAYCEHAKREAVLKQAPIQTHNVYELTAALKQIFPHCALPI